MGFWLFSDVVRLLFEAAPEAYERIEEGADMEAVATWITIARIFHWEEAAPVVDNALANVWEHILLGKSLNLPKIREALRFIDGVKAELPSEYALTLRALGEGLGLTPLLDYADAVKTGGTTTEDAERLARMVEERILGWRPRTLSEMEKLLSIAHNATCAVRWSAPGTPLFYMERGLEAARNALDTLNYL